MEQQSSLCLAIISCKPNILKRTIQHIEHALLRTKSMKRTSSEFTVKIICPNDLLAVGSNSLDNLFASMFRLFHAMKEVVGWKDIRFILSFEGYNVKTTITTTCFCTTPD